MYGTSKKVRRLEKEAVLRAKKFEQTREVSDNLLSSLNLNYEDDDTERHRRHITTRPIRQIQREVDYPVETMDKITERIQNDLKRRQLSTSTSDRTNQTSSSTSAEDRTTRATGATKKYTSTKHNSDDKIN